MNNYRPGIMHVITGLATGGAERALFNLLAGGLNKRFNNCVVSLGDEGTMGPRIQSLGVPVYTLDMRGGRPSYSGLKKLRNILGETKPEILQGWMYHGNLLAGLGRIMTPSRPALAWNVRHSLYDIGDEKWMTRQVVRANRFFSNSPDVIVYNSQLSRAQHEAFGFLSGNGKVIPNGVDIKTFCPDQQARSRSRDALGIPDSAPVVGHVARLHPMKDHPAFLRAAVDIAVRQTEVHFILGGRGVALQDGKLAALIPDVVRNRFHLLDERNDVPDLMNAMDIFCQSSWSEAFPNVLGEAMASEVPCVATDVGDSAMIVADTGVVVSPRDISALVQGMERLLMMPVDERNALAVRARKRICENYTLKSIVEKYAVLYEQLVRLKKKVV